MSYIKKSGFYSIDVTFFQLMEAIREDQQLCKQNMFFVETESEKYKCTEIWFKWLFWYASQTYKLTSQKLSYRLFFHIMHFLGDNVEWYDIILPCVGRCYKIVLC